MSLTEKQKIGIGLGIAGVGVAIAKLLRGQGPEVPTPVDPVTPPECAFGEADQCFGSDLYECTSTGKWKLVERNSSKCTPEKQIKLDDLTIMPSLPATGEIVHVRCRATNHSAIGETLIRQINLMVDGIQVMNWSLTLPWAESVYLEHTITASGLGIHTVEFDGLSKTFEVVYEPPPNLLEQELVKVFDGPALYPQLSHGDPDLDYKSRALETADFEIVSHDLYIPSNDKAIWTFDGNWTLGSNLLPYMGAVLRLIDANEYDNAARYLPSRWCRERYPGPYYGYEEYYSKFASCCLDKGYFLQDWWRWVMETPWVIDFQQSSTDPVSVANQAVVDERANEHTTGRYNFYAESFFGWMPRDEFPPQWHYPPTYMSWVAILEINVALKLTSGDKVIYPLYAYRIGRLTF